jgi:hypothetical protein
VRQAVPAVDEFFDGEQQNLILSYRSSP